jgi:hypothetical protein
MSTEAFRELLTQRANAAGLGLDSDLAGKLEKLLSLS